MGNNSGKEKTNKKTPKRSPLSNALQALKDIEIDNNKKKLDYKVDWLLISGGASL